MYFYMLYNARLTGWFWASDSTTKSSANILQRSITERALNYGDKNTWVSLKLNSTSYSQRDLRQVPKTPGPQFPHL